MVVLDEGNPEQAGILAGGPKIISINRVDG